MDAIVTAIDTHNTGLELTIESMKSDNELLLKLGEIVVMSVPIVYAASLVTYRTFDAGGIFGKGDEMTDMLGKWDK